MFSQHLCGFPLGALVTPIWCRTGYVCEKEDSRDQRLLMEVCPCFYFSFSSFTHELVSACIVRIRYTNKTPNEKLVAMSKFKLTVSILCLCLCRLHQFCCSLTHAVLHESTNKSLKWPGGEYTQVSSGTQWGRGSFKGCLDGRRVLSCLKNFHLLVVVGCFHPGLGSRCNISNQINQSIN